MILVQRNQSNLVSPSTDRVSAPGLAAVINIEQTPVVYRAQTENSGHINV